MNGNKGNRNVATAGLPGAHELVKQAWQHYKERWQTFLGVMIIPIMCSALAMLVLSASAMFEFRGVTLTDMGHVLTVDKGITLAVIAFIVLMIIIVVQSWGHVALLYAANAPAPISIGEAYRTSRHFILSYWWVSFLAHFVIGIGFLLFFIPGLIFFVWYHLAPFILIAENAKGSSALSRSHHYVKGHWWGVFHRQVIFIISISFVTGVTVIGLTVLLTSLSQALSMPLLKNDALIAFMSHFVAGIIIVPLTAVFWFILYKNLKRLKR